MASETGLDDFASLLEEFGDDVARLRQLADAVRDQPGSEVFLFRTLHRIYSNTHADADLDLAISAGQASLEIPGTTTTANSATDPIADLDPGRSQAAEDLARMLWARFQRSYRQEDLDDAARWAQKALGGSSSDSQRYTNLLRLCADLLDTHDRLSGRSAPDSPGFGDEEVFLRMYDPVTLQAVMGDLTGNRQDLSATHSGLGQPAAMSLSEQRFALYNLQRAQCITLWHETKEPTLLEEAIRAAKGALALVTETSSAGFSPGTRRHLQLIALFFAGHLMEVKVKWNRGSNDDDIEYAVRCLRGAGEGGEGCLGNPERDLIRAYSLSQLLGIRQAKRGRWDDIREAVEMAEQAVAIARKRVEPPSRERAEQLGKALVNLAQQLRILFETQGDKSMAVIQRALSSVQEARKVVDGDAQASDWAMHSIQASIFLRMYEHSLDLKYLNQGIELCEAIETEARDPNAPSQSASMLTEMRFVLKWSMLSMLLAERFERLGAKRDIDRAIAAGEESIALGTTLVDHDGVLSNLAYKYLARSVKHKQSPADISRAIDLASDAVSRTPDGHSKRCRHLDLLASLFMHQYQISGSTADIDHAVKLGEEAVDAALPGTPYGLGSKSNLATLLYRKASHSVGIDASFMPRRLPTLDDYMAGREEIDRAISLMKEVVSGTPSNTVHWAIRRGTLGCMLWARWHSLRLDEDFEEAIKHLSLVSDCAAATPAERITSSIFAADLLIFRKRSLHHAHRLLRSAAHLLPCLSPRSLDQQVQQSWVRRFAGLATTAASATLEADAGATEAVEILEVARGVILGMLFDMRSDIGRLWEERPDLARKFETLRDQLDAPSVYDHDSLQSQGHIEHTAMPTNPKFILTRRQRAASELDALLREIREVPSLDKFMQSPTIRDMEHAAANGPIIIVNTSVLRSDAFIIKRGGNGPSPDTVSLPSLEFHEIRKWAALLRSGPITSVVTQEQMFELLEWLWDVLVCPVLNRLGFLPDRRQTATTPAQSRPSVPSDSEQPSGGNPPDCSEELPRIWWIPTGQLCSLPIHAAGRYRGPEASPTTNLPDLALSSYSPSVRAMLYTDQNPLRRSRSEGIRQALLASAAKVPNLEYLPGAEPEVNAVHNLLQQSSLPDQASVPPSASSASDSNPASTTSFPPDNSGDDQTDDQTPPLPIHDATRAAVLEKLPRATIFHYAGHATSHLADPLRSALCLTDCHLTVRDLLNLKLHRNPPFLALLQACLTGAGGDKGLADEGIHLMSAFQLVGFRHVVGSLWEVSDSHCVDVATAVMRAVVDGKGADEAVSKGLRDGVVGLRSGLRRGAGKRAEGDAALGGGDSEDENAGTDRATPTISALPLHMKILGRGGDPRIWAAYIHIGP